MRFTKLHGLGNDYIYINTLEEDLSAYDLPKLSRVLSDRHFGIGGDGIILVCPSGVADFRMRMLNADGSESEMCGNGMRAFAKFVYEHGLTDKTSLAVETGAGIIKPELTVVDGVVTLVRVDMGEPRLAREAIPMLGEPKDQPVIGADLQVGGQTLSVTCVSVGNPHCITFVDDVAKYPVPEVGPLVENHELFPRRINAEFVEVLSREHVKMRVWERGSGETMACGTGATSTAVACILNDKCDRKVTVTLLGGDLQIEWAEDNHLFLTGPANEAFSGEVHPSLLAQAEV